MTKFQMITALMTGGALHTSEVTFKIVNSVEREDGSGHCWIISGYDMQGKAAKTFVRSID